MCSPMTKISAARAVQARFLSAWLRLLSLLGVCVLVAALAPVMAVAASAGTIKFAAGSVPLLADPQGASLGTVTPGTPVMVVKEEGSLNEVKIEGWSMQGAEQIVFAAKGRRIMLARLSADRPANRIVGARSQDQYGGVWEQVTVTGWMQSSSLVADVTPIWKEAHDLFATRCATCHALHQPTEFTANQWPHILQTMTKRAVLTADQTALVTQYLQTHARPTGPPPGKGPGYGVGANANH
jgi:Dihaem cytochrome c